MKRILLPILLLIISVQLVAQTKTGTIDSDLILSKMPELTKIQEELKSFNSKLEGELKAKYNTYQAKIEDYQTKESTYTDLLKKTKQEEIINLENEITKFKQEGTLSVQKEQNRLLQPLYDKIDKILKEVAKAEGYTQVFTTSTSGLAFIEPKYDLTQSVMNKLGIKLQ